MEARDLTESNRMAATGSVLAVCEGSGGIPKHSVAEGRVGPTGLAGDRHRHPEHGGRERALCLLSMEEVRSLEQDGVTFAGPGQFGENLLIEGLDPRVLRPGDTLEIGAELAIQLSDVREPCSVLRSIDRRFPDLMVGRSGFVARVLRAGRVRPGDPVRRRDE
jgi:MOSC domain-containing protein YiiM